mgnify:CR=1 FL=1
MQVSNDLGTGVALFFIFIFIVLAAIFLIALINYILISIAVYRIAKRRGIDHAFLAWIPVAQNYLYAELIGTNVKVGNVTVPQYPWIYVGIVNGGTFLAGIIQNVSQLSSLNSLEQMSNYGHSIASNFGTMAASLIALALYLVITVVRIYTMYRVFKLFKGNTVLYTVLGSLILFAEPIILLILSNKPFAEEPEAVPAA